MSFLLQRKRPVYVGRPSFSSETGVVFVSIPSSTDVAVIKDFTKGATKTLVATDVAARGLDVEDITLVVCCLSTKPPPPRILPRTKALWSGFMNNSIPLIGPY